jgi:hypothetical protein
MHIKKKIMDNKKNNHSGRNGHHQNPLPGEISRSDKKSNSEAHKAADRDMENDPELSAHSPNDDLDEGETARLGEDKTDLV